MQRAPRNLAISQTLTEGWVHTGGFKGGQSHWIAHSMVLTGLKNEPSKGNVYTLALGRLIGNRAGYELGNVTFPVRGKAQLAKASPHKTSYRWCEQDPKVITGSDSGCDPFN